MLGREQLSGCSTGIPHRRPTRQVQKMHARMLQKHVRCNIEAQRVAEGLKCHSVVANTRCTKGTEEGLEVGIGRRTL